MQIEALGAPTPAMVLQGKYEQKSTGTKDNDANIGKQSL